MHDLLPGRQLRVRLGLRLGRCNFSLKCLINISFYRLEVMFI